MNTRTVHSRLIGIYKAMGFLHPCISDEEFGVNLLRQGAWTQNRRKRKMRHYKNL